MTVRETGTSLCARRISRQKRFDIATQVERRTKTMIELSTERIEQILNEETVKKAETTAILRSIYTRYMLLYERYFTDIDALNDDKIAQFKNYHEETISLFKYYYLDIPQDTCEPLLKFEKEYTSKLLGSDWHKYLFGAYKEFKENITCKNNDEAYLKAAFSKQALEAFYYEMDNVFREGFGTDSKALQNAITGFASLFLGKK